MDLKFLSWNVQHFSGNGDGVRADRVDRVAAFVRAENPDVFAISEVTGSSVFRSFTRDFPDFTLSITEGRQSQEIMVGIRNGLTAFVTHRTEFKRNNPFLRPGVLVTITGDTPDLPLSVLFAHFKSSSSPEGFGLRDAMVLKARNLKKKIDETLSDPPLDLPDQSARFMLVGDLNTMGMDLTFSRKDMASLEEIERLDDVLRSRRIRRLPTSHPFSYNDGRKDTYPDSLLDHVYATENLEFLSLAGGAMVRLAGWPEEPTVAAQNDWIDEFSDHAALIFEVKDI